MVRPRPCSRASTATPCNRLRAEIEPVSPADFMRFLFKWQHVDPPDRLTGLDGLREAVAHARRLRAGRGGVGALGPARRGSRATTRRCSTCSASRERSRGRGCRIPTAPHADPPRLAPATPIALFLREHADAWQSLRAPVDGSGAARLNDGARRLLDALRARGASFFGDLRGAAALDDEAARSAIGSLVAAGLAASDGFSGLRALVVERRRRAGGARSAGALRRAMDGDRRHRRSSSARRARRGGRSAGLDAPPPLRRRLPAPPGARGARRPVARADARLPPARGARRDPRRTLRLGHVRRAVRAAARGRAAAGGPAHRRRRPRCSPSAPPIRSTWPASSPPATASAPPRATAWSTATASRSRCAKGTSSATLAPIDPAIAADVSRAQPPPRRFVQTPPRRLSEGLPLRLPLARDARAFCDV